jgi:heat shock protein HslJ
MQAVRALTVIVASLLVVACASSAAPSGGGAVDIGGDWTLASGTVDGAPFPLPPGAQITLTVQGTSIGGRAACNHYGGEIVVDADGTPHFNVTSMTEMACEEPVMAAEAAFMAAMARIRSVTRDVDRLTLGGAGVELAFDRLPPVPVADLVGTDWVLESIVSGDAVSSVAGEPATLRLEPTGTFAGSTGCRTFTGRWVFANGGISPTDLGMDGECPPRLAQQDGHVVSVLEGFRASVDGDILTLSGDGGDGLIYRARTRDTDQPS